MNWSDEDLDDDRDEYDFRRSDRDIRLNKHSGLGIAAFILAIGMGLFLFALVMVAGVLETTNPGGLDDDSPLTLVLGFAILGSLFVDLLALGLAIAGLSQHNRKKVFAVLGLVFSILFLLGVLCLFVIGLALG